MKAVIFMLYKGIRTNAQATSPMAMPWVSDDLINTTPASWLAYAGVIIKFARCRMLVSNTIGGGSSNDKNPGI